MKILTLLCISLVILIEVHAKKLDSGTNAVHGSTSASASASASASESASASASSTSKTSQDPSQSKKKRYATREVILYLTPSQIKALEAGEGLVRLQSSSEPVGQEQPTNQDLKLQEQTEFVKQEFENLKSASIQQIEQPNEEHLELASQEPILPKELLSALNQQELDDQWRQEQANREEQLKLHNYYHELNKAEQLKLQQVNDERKAWFPYNSNAEISEGYGVPEAIQHHQFVGTNQFQLKVLSPLPLYEQNSERFLSQSEKPLLQLQYSPKYNDQKKAIEIENILRTHHHHELEKQNALIQAEKIANAPAILVHDHVKIAKQYAVPVVKHVKVPVPTPIWISIPQPIPVRVPQPYPEYQQVIKHIPVPIEQKEGGEIEKPVPYNVENGIPASLTKVLFFNIGTPYVDQKIVPVEISH